MSERHAAMMDFLRQAGWGSADVQALPGDASTRRYFRVAAGGRHAMLMDQPQHAETPAAHPEATPQERHALGYNAVARLAALLAVALLPWAAGLSGGAQGETPAAFDAGFTRAMWISAVAAVVGGLISFATIDRHRSADQ